MATFYTIKLRRGLAADWTAVNPVLAEGETGWELDTRNFKQGDGSTAWNDLEYIIDGNDRVPDPSGLPDGQIMVTDSGAWIITDLPPTSDPNAMLSSPAHALYTYDNVAPTDPADGDIWTNPDEDAVTGPPGPPGADGAPGAPGADATRGPITINNQTGTTYTLVLADATKWIRLSNAGAITLTVPANADEAFPVGTQIEGNQAGAGQVTIAPAAGVTINAVPGLKVAAQYGVFGLLKVGTNTWLAYGRLSA